MVKHDTPPVVAAAEVEKAAMMTAPMGFDNQESVKDWGDPRY